MKVWITILLTICSILLFIILLTLLISFICFHKIFYSSRKISKEEYPIPKGKVYEIHREALINWMKTVRNMPHKDVSIKSFDGLTLRGRYFEYDKEAPTEILFHGYKGDSDRDLSAGVLRCFSLKHNALIVDNRASGKSDGKVITFGINEVKDCIKWIHFYIDKISSTNKIILTGISMGAAIVMMASAQELPKNVIGVLADCGYTSAQEIIKKVIKDMKLPPNILYPFVKIGAKVYGKFNIDEYSPLKAMKETKLPIIFIHGDIDGFVPHYMSVKNYEACVSKKKLVTIKGADHGLCYVINPEKYLNELEDFFSPLLK